MRFFDPFCGSGTILQSVLANVLELPVREDFEVLGMPEWYDYQGEEHDEILRGLRDQARANIEGKLLISDFSYFLDFRVSMIGSDLMAEQLEHCRLNMTKMNSMHNLDLLKPAPRFKQELVDHSLVLDNEEEIQETVDAQKTSPSSLNVENEHFEFNLKHPTFYFGNYLKLLQTDFKDIPDTFRDSFQGFDVLTNPPFSPYSPEDNQTEKLQKSKKRAVALEKKYQNFDKFLYENKENLRNVFIFYPMQISKKQYHYIAESDHDWECQRVINSGGLRLGVWGYSKVLKSEKKILVNFVKNFLGRRKDVQGLESGEMKQVVLEELKETQFEGKEGWVSELVDSWKSGKIEKKGKKRGKNKVSEASTSSPEVSIDGKTRDLKQFSASEMMSEMLEQDIITDLAELKSKPLKDTDYIATLNWSNKGEKRKILVERKKRRNAYLKAQKEKAAADRLRAETERSKRREKVVQKLESRVRDLGVVEEDYLLIKKKVDKQAKDKVKAILEIKEKAKNYDPKSHRKW